MSNSVITENGFKAREIGLRAQKKILSRMATKNIAKTFIDGPTASLLDNVYRLAKLHMGNKKDAEKLVKNIIKIVIKIGILQKNNQFNVEEEKYLDRFRHKFTNTQMAIISFYEVDFSFDLPYIQKALEESCTALKCAVKRHLTDKSINRIDEVFGFFGDTTLLETAFKQNSPYKDIIGKIVADLNQTLDNGDI